MDRTNTKLYFPMIETSSFKGSMCAPFFRNENRSSRKKATGNERCKIRACVCVCVYIHIYRDIYITTDKSSVGKERSLKSFASTLSREEDTFGGSLFYIKLHYQRCRRELFFFFFFFFSSKHLQK